MTRRAAVMKVQIARRDLGLDDDTYRTILERLTGHKSSTACSDAELGRVLDEFKAKGWTPKVIAGANARRPESRKARPAADHPSARKARALWISLWNLGEVRDSSEAALEAFARRQLSTIERLQWADQGLMYKVIEALKAVAERAGWSQQLDKRHAGREVLVLKHRLFEAQTLKLLARDGAAVLPKDRLTTEEALDAAIAAAGRAIRDGTAG
jgi:phage gp16-like protein